jgi:hypothetical protein
MSAGIAALIAHVSFWVLLAYGWFWEEVGVRTTTSSGKSRASRHWIVASTIRTAAIRSAE